MFTPIMRRVWAAIATAVAIVAVFTVLAVAHRMPTTSATGTSAGHLVWVRSDDGGLVPVSYVQRPTGTGRAVGPRGFALVVDDDRLERRGLHPGDVVFCNPGEPFGDGSLCVVGLDGAAGAGPLALRELVARRGNLDARTAPPAGAPSTTPAGDFFPYAPVTALQAVWTLPEGRGHPDDLHRLGRQPRPGPRGTPLDYSSDAGGDGPLAVRR